jgi:hypothetical protein
MLLQLVLSVFVVIAVASLLSQTTTKIIIATITMALAAYPVDSLLNLPVVGATMFISSVLVLLMTLLTKASERITNP